MTHEQAHAAARSWVTNSARRTPGYAGAYLSGSFLEHAPGAPWPPDSDVDVVILCRSTSLPPAGKFFHEGALIEASYLSAEEFIDPAHVLTVHYLSYALSHAVILDDPEALLTPLSRLVRAEYARPEWVRARWRAMLAEIDRGISGFDPAAPFHVQAMSWLFTAGKAPFPPLIAALKNCTVRKRFCAARSALHALDCDALMPQLLAPLLGDHFHPHTLPRHIDALELAFQAACASRGPSQTYRFRSDISPHAHALSVGWCRAMLAQPHPEDCVFWLGATWARCLTILWMDENPAYPAHMDGLKLLLAECGIESAAELAARMSALRDLLPRLEQLSQSVLAAREAQ